MLRSKTTYIAPKRKVLSATSDSNTKSQESQIPTHTHRCLFELSSRKRKQASSLETSSRKCKPSATPTSLVSSTPLAGSPPTSNSCGLKSLRPLVTTPPATSANRLQSSTPAPLPSTISLSCLVYSTSSCDVFSASYPREQLLMCNLPPVDCSVTVHETMLVRVPVNFIFTNMATLEKRPPTCVVTPEGPCGISELQKFQAVLPGYQIKVMSIDPPHMLIFVGPTPSDKIIRIIKDDHYDGSNSFSGFLSKSYFCDECNRGYNTEDHEKSSLYQKMVPILLSKRLPGFRRS